MKALRIYNEPKHVQKTLVHQLKKLLNSSYQKSVGSFCIFDVHLVQLPPISIELKHF